MSVDTGPHHSAVKWPIWTNHYGLAQADIIKIRDLVKHLLLPHSIQMFYFKTNQSDFMYFEFPLCEIHKRLFQGWNLVWVFHGWLSFCSLIKHKPMETDMKYIRGIHFLTARASKFAFFACKSNCFIQQSKLWCCTWCKDMDTQAAQIIAYAYWGCLHSSGVTQSKPAFIPLPTMEMMWKSYLEVLGNSSTNSLHHVTQKAMQE